MKLRKEIYSYNYGDKYAANNDSSIEADVAKGGKKAPFAVAEAYKLIRTNILFLLAQKNGNVIAISSSGANEGKSTTAVNVAIAFSQLGGKVLLVDGDLRRSSVHKKLKIENEDGLSNVLVNFSKISTAVQHLNDNLDILTAGPIPPNPSEMLGSANFESFVNEAKEIYDYVIIDTPPINIVSDALVIAPRTDGLVLVVRDNVTPYDAVQHTIEAVEFANINILGTIMNGVNSRGNKRYTYRKYSKYSKYSRYGYSGYGYGGYGYGGYGYGYGYGYGGYDRVANKDTKEKKEKNKDEK